MSLNNSQMLPERTRNMRQLQEVLSAEDIILSEIEKIIDEMYDRASLLHEELVNEEWLEKNIGRIVDAIVEVSKREEQLHVDILISIANLTKATEEEVIDFLNKWLPAHLAYSVSYNEYLKAKNYFAILWQDDEIITIRQVEL